MKEAHSTRFTLNLGADGALVVAWIFNKNRSFPKLMVCHGHLVAIVGETRDVNKTQIAGIIGLPSFRRTKSLIN